MSSIVAGTDNQSKPDTVPAIQELSTVQQGDREVIRHIQRVSGGFGTPARAWCSVCAQIFVAGMLNN